MQTLIVLTTLIVGFTRRGEVTEFCVLTSILAMHINLKLYRTNIKIGYLDCKKT